MTCEKCGTEFKNDNLICPNCGADYQVVPDFVPEIDISIEETIKSITNEIEDKEIQEKRKKKIIIISIISFFAILVVVFCSIWFYSKSYSANIKKAEKEYKANNYQNALEFYQKALDKNPASDKCRLYIAYCHYYLENYFLYESVSLNLIDDLNVDEAVRFNAADLLCAYYVNNDDFTKLNRFMKNLNNLEINDKYKQYMAEKPVFNTITGEDGKSVYVEISSPDQSQIFYDIVYMHSGIDDTFFFEYTEPIKIEPGDWSVYSRCRNKLGSYSDLVIYDVSVPFPDIAMPNLLVDSGELYEPVMLSIADHGLNIFYTIDGTVPTNESLPYEHPIPLQMGEHNINFIAYEDGYYSDVLECYFNIDLRNTISPEDAVNLVYEYQAEVGDIDNFVYRYQYPAKVNGLGNCFIVDEYYIDSYGNEAATGIHFGVEYNTNLLSRVILEDWEYEIFS